MVTIRCVYDEGAIEETPLIGAKGTSFVIESEGERLLFDTGLRHRYLLHNMEHLEIGPDTIDAVAISQTHPDNCRALNGFLDARTQPVPIYCPAELREGSKGFFGKKGVSEENAQKADFRDFSGWTEVIPKVWLSPAMAYTNGYSEMFLAVASRKLAIVSGRGVAGPDVILAEAERRFERKPTVFVGSLLLAKKMKQEAARYATDLESMGVTDIYLNHCTSPEGMTQLRLKLGLKGVKEFYVGQTLEVRALGKRVINDRTIRPGMGLFSSAPQKSGSSEDEVRRIVKKVLDGANVKYEVADDHVISTGFMGDDLPIRMIITTDNSRLAFVCLLDLVAEKSAFPKVTWELNRINSNLAFGAFYMNPEDGHIFFEYAFPYATSPVTDEFVATFIRLVAQVVDDHDGDLKKLAESGCSRSHDPMIGRGRCRPNQTIFSYIYI